MDLVGKDIAGRYEVLEKAGNGGMATVYRAKDRVLNRLVAVKVLKEEYTTDAEFVRRFNIEAQSAACLTHPNIVSVYDVGHEAGVYYIVMELVQGRTLKQIINEEGTLPWKWSVNIALQIASALETAHKNNIVHRDIKPHNIIITEDGVAKVTDFGIAKAVSNSTITAFGTTIGSVHYFSPEHAKGGVTDAKSDLYSLGVVMYEMLTGRVPFDADTPVSIALKHMQEKPIEPIKLNPSLPFALNQIIVKAMQKDPEARYQSATEMVKDLTLALKNPEGNFVEEGTSSSEYKPKAETIKEYKEEEKKDNKKKKKENIFTKNPKLKIALWAGIALIVFLVTIIITKSAMDAGTPKDIEIPNLIGLTEKEATDKLKELNIEFEKKDDDYSKDVEKGKVMKQTPEYREKFKMKQNTKMTITLSKGTEMTVVPKIVGETSYDAAAKKITEAKLKAEKVEEISEKVEAGVIIKQEPDDGTEIAAGETVKVYVSKGNGKEKVPVPYLIGKSEGTAKQEAENAKLAVEVVYEEDKAKPDGTVLKQSIEVSEIVDEGTTIRLTVNKIEQIKEGTVNVNLKSLINYTKPSSKTNAVAEDETAEVKITVDGDTVYSERNEKTTTKITQTIEGKGTVEVKVYVDDVVKGTKNLDLNKSNAVVNFE